MNASSTISRRLFAGGLACVGLRPPRALAQGFAALGSKADSYAQVTPGKVFSFPADHGAHPDYRIEWWYLTANLIDSERVSYGVQWTLFRQAVAPGAQGEGWANQHMFMGHAAVTRADTHRFAETYARGGVGQAGVDAEPFQAWIDSWEMRATSRREFDVTTVSPLEVKSQGKDFSYMLRLEADHPLVLQGEAGYSAKSEREQASYYYSQPFFHGAGRLVIDGRPVDVTGLAWMDREWSSQPLAPEQTGWDWFALHFDSGEKLMLYRMREKHGGGYITGNWIAPAGGSKRFAAADVEMTPQAFVDVTGRKLPLQWRITVAQLSLSVACAPLNPKAWMGTSFAYWEGPVSVSGSHSGVGYLELTGY